MKEIRVRNLISLTVLVAAILVSGCSSGPSCSNDDARDTALQLVKDQFMEQATAYGRTPTSEDLAQIDSLEIKDVEDISFSDTPENECKCQATIVGPSGNTTLTYSVQVNRDGDAYVSLEGLQ
jgi:hypothetical protein